MWNVPLLMTLPVTGVTTVVVTYSIIQLVTYISDVHIEAKFGLY